MSGGRYGPNKTPERRCMPLALWPEADRTVWQNALTPGTILDDHLGALAHLSVASNHKVERGYGRFLTYCKIHEPDCLQEAPAERISPQRVRSYVNHLTDIGNSTQTIMARLQDLGSMASLLAPELDWSFINRLASRIRARHKPAREKSRILMTDELAQLGYDLMHAAQGDDSISDAVHYRDGLMIALLAYVPIRRKNFTALEIGSSIVRRQGQWFIQLTPEQTKTHAWFETTLPPALEPYLQRYLDFYRPMLVACKGRWQKPTGDFLWISNHGSPMTQDGLYSRICRQTGERFGEHCSPHMFRDAAASTLATEAPEYVRLAAPLLGHRSFQTTEKYYRQAKAQEGHDRFTQAITALRGEG
jgi:integrase/recombinase XerD